MATWGADLSESEQETLVGYLASRYHPEAGPVVIEEAGNQVLADRPRFWDTVLNGRGGMPPWGSTLTGQEIADIHRWLHTLK
jgi:hypothetical protein